MRKFTLALVLVLLSLSAVIADSSGVTNPCPGATTCPLTTDVSAFYTWMPVIILATMLGIMVSLMYYAAAVLLGNSRLKAAAINEFAQVTGTVVVLVIVIMIFNVYGSAVYSGATGVTTSVKNICTQLAGSQLDITNTMIPGPTMAVCSQIINGGSSSQGSRDPTQNIDFGLGETYVITANLTSQEAFSLDILNVYETYFYVLATFTPTEIVCMSEPNAPCIAYPYGGPTAVYSYTPFQFYTKLRAGTIYVNTESQLAFYMGLLQMLLIMLMLFGWPYILAAGLIMRASSFTRRAGGMVIAIVLVGMFLYPILSLFEYASLTNATSPLTAVGATSTAFPAMTLTGQEPQAFTIGSWLPGSSNPNPKIDYDTSKINFYVFPRIDYIINYYGCWPPNGSVLEAEALLGGSYSVPGVGLYLAIRDTVGTFSGTLPEPDIPGFNCSPANMERTWLALSNFYGQVFVFTLLLPVFNILMLLSAVKGISTVLGGDTSLFGISRLL
ncbi:MAG TPA: hypothetical protein VL945_00505 [Candidatus Saccharimonadales bacterium]|nr:hypothetical protein [Candidatus Saccharimonadales bacterium]